MSEWEGYRAANAVIPGRNNAWRHKHISGIEIRHCGHPTALWPYYLVGEKAPRSLLTFSLLEDAKHCVEHLDKHGELPTWAIVNQEPS